MHRLRVLLVNLPHADRIQRRYGASYHAPNFLVPPTELLGLAALLRQRSNAEPVVVDAIAEGLDAGAVARRVERADLVVGLTGYHSLHEDSATLAILGRRLDARTITFGYLASRDPETLLERHPALHGVLVDEPEHTLLELCRRLEAMSGFAAAAEGLPGLVWQDCGAVRRGPARGRIDDLDALPFPDHSLIELDRYGESYVPGPIGAVMTARGCPYSCTFCARAWGDDVRYRSPASLRRELRGLYELGLRNVRFMDDTFTLKRERVVELCEGLQEELPGLRWTCLTRLDRVDPELCALMADAGCHRMYVGVETADPARLASYGKGLDHAAIERGVRAARGAGIEVCGFFIVGAPGETADDSLRAADYAIELDLDYVIVTGLQRWEGTALTEQLGDALDDDEERRFDLERRFYRRFYGRPRFIWNHIRRTVRHPRDTVLGALALSRFLAGQLRGRDLI